jgi:hypothetical protein
MKKHYIIFGSLVALLLAVLLYLHFHNRKKDKAERYPSGSKTSRRKKQTAAAGNTEPGTPQGVMETDPGMSQTPLDESVILDSEGGHSVMPKGAQVESNNPFTNILGI